ncbi:ATP-binding protein [Actinoplanes sp. NBRC 103695]|uniref:sensor histidine kinase n=1 Tax=Actinoplanes sp. NBRC 103695 TaxID=3032202 RepID=UPI0024A34B63|nr:ATP-binding protein [Actinoplanes sp. NBRC 103695]GLY96649.1 ATPase [Actinoplanes sp. NBRC 103695]
MTETAPSDTRRDPDANPLPGQLAWLIALPSVATVTLYAVTIGYLRGDARTSTLVLPYLIAIGAIMIAAAYAIGLIRRTGVRTAALRASTVDARAALAERHAELAEARSERDRIAELLLEAQTRPAAAAASEAHAAGRQVEVFVNLSRRLQSLVHREIKLLDALENEVEDPDLLKGLFQVDHLATRIRRHAENLAVLGGSVSRRQWSRPVALIEVLRSAIAEVEHYSRVKLVPPIEGTVPGHVVASVIHLVAELIENATMFAPPQTHVILRAQQVAAGVAIEVEDRGLGVQRPDQDRLNKLLANPEDINLDDLLRDGRIGLFVVSMIARQHGILVRLQTNIYGGTQAVVILPQVLIAPPVEPERHARPETLAQHTIEFAQPASWSAFTPRGEATRPGVHNGQNGHNSPNGQSSHNGHSGQISQNGDHPDPPALRPTAPAMADVPPTTERPPLPRRRSQTHMAPQLQLGPSAPPDDPAGEHDTGLMASFMHGVSMGEKDQRTPAQQEGPRPHVEH